MRASEGKAASTGCAACGEILYELAVELGQLTPAVALPLYVAVSTDTGCFVYSNVTANTHRVAAALMETGIDYRAANKRHFRTKTKKRLALEAELLRTMEFYDEGRVVVVTLPLSLAERLSLTEADMDDVSALGGVVEGTDCSITMKETKDGAWKISVRTGARVNATKACAALGGGGHRAASGCVYHGSLCRREGGDPRRRAGCGGGIKSSFALRRNANGANAPNAWRKGGAIYAGRHSHHRQADRLDEHGRVPPHAVDDRAGTPSDFHPRRK